MAEQWPAGGFDGSRPGGPGDGFDELDNFGGDYQAQAKFRPGLETLANGEYDFEFTEAKLDRINDDLVMRTGLKVNGARVIERVWWLNTQDALNRFGADMLALGFDADRWGPANNRPLSREVPKVVARLPGVRFRGTKASRPKLDFAKQPTGEHWHDLHISGRVSGQVSPPTQQTPHRNAQPAGSAPAGGNIPF